MNAGAITFTPIFFLMKEHLEQLKLPLRMEINGLISGIKSILGSDVTNLNDSIRDHLPQIFNIRIKSVQWIIEDGGPLDFENNYNEMNEVIVPLTSHPKYGILAENCSFALRTNRRVCNAILAQLGAGEVDGGIHKIAQIEIDYPQLILALNSSLPYNKELENLKDWIDTSLRIELIVFSLILIDEYHLDVQDQIIDKLSEIIVNDSHQYYAIAKLHNLIPTKQEKTDSQFPSVSFLSEQQYLSELGIEDFLNSIDQ